MTQSIRIEAKLTLAQLLARLTVLEMTHGSILDLSHGDEGGPHTIAVVGDERVPAFSLDLILDPKGDAERPAGGEPVCRGIVYLKGELKRVAAFRRPESSFDPATMEGQTWAMRRPRAARVDRGRRSSRRAGSGRNPGAGWGIEDAGWGNRVETEEAPPRPAKAKAKARRPSAAAQAKLEPHEYRVWFGTNRKPVDPAQIAKGFSAERDEKVRYGHCDVYVPESHKIGSIGSSLLIRMLKGTDDRLKLRRLAELAREDFWAGIGRQIGSAAPGKRHAVVFIHGYRVSFRDAALRTAQIGSDLGIEGAMAFFSWPSKGTLLGYVADGNAIEGSEAAIADFLVDFTRRSGAEAVHVIAHSMGNRGLLRAANRIVAAAVRRGGGRFGQIILAAPDVDADNFRDLAAAYRKLAKRTTLYVSSKDLAVQLARWISDYARVGFHPPVTVVDGIDTVSVTNLDLTLLGHGYVAEAREVLHDMAALITDNKAPPRFGQKEKRTPEGRRYWEVCA